MCVCMCVCVHALTCPCGGAPQPSQHEIAQAYLTALRTGLQPSGPGTGGPTDPLGAAAAAAGFGSTLPQHRTFVALSEAAPQPSPSQLLPLPRPTLLKAAAHSRGFRPNLDPDLAAIRIQAAFRGHHTRRQLTTAAAAAAGAIPASEPLPSRRPLSRGGSRESYPAAAVLNASGALIPGMVKYGPYSAVHERAAVRIQAAHRGYQVRKRVALERQRRQPPAAAAAAVAVDSAAPSVLVPVAMAVTAAGAQSETQSFTAAAAATAAADASRRRRSITTMISNSIYGVRHEQAAVRIQAAWKGRQARKLYAWVRQAAAEQDDLDLMLDPEEVAALSRNVSLSARAGGSRRAVRLAEGMAPSGVGDGNPGEMAVVAGIAAAEAAEAAAAANSSDGLRRYGHLEGSYDVGLDKVAPSVGASSNTSAAESFGSPEPPPAPEAPALAPRSANPSLRRNASRSTAAATAATVAATASRGSSRRTVVPLIGLTEEGQVVGDLGELDLLELESTGNMSEDGGGGGDGVGSGFGVVQHGDDDDDDNMLDGAGSEASVF
ncbi:hypothetical protein Vretifemale_13549 [Volvox reticuliferus]|uniref:Uncharacterized protein n=1 Tax=Volvox reticuliferus TaxID=1737510 RepID=A0A8J4FPR6_9CHLO|nr:hypothetical protein Vretifemale_13549 [Volvox reticuliferus]